MSLAQAPFLDCWHWPTLSTGTALTSLSREAARDPGTPGGSDGVQSKEEGAAEEGTTRTPTSTATLAAEGTAAAAVSSGLSMWPRRGHRLY